MVEDVTEFAERSYVARLYSRKFFPKNVRGEIGVLEFLVSNVSVMEGHCEFNSLCVRFGV